MTNNARGSNGIRRAFYENARWLILNLVFLKLRSERGDELMLDDALKSDIAKATIDLAEELLTVCEVQGFVSKRTVDAGEPYEQARHFRSVFSSPADCQLLRGALLSRLAAVGPAAAATEPTQAESSQ